MKTITVEAYVTSDGKNFTDFAEAQNHEVKTTMGKEIAIYLAEVSKALEEPLSQRALTMRTNAIMEWEQYRAAKTASNIPAIQAVK